jgi:eukaryotic-like serine/threonine-protein kinase
LKDFNFVNSWKMFKGNPRRTGLSTSKPISRPSLRWIAEVGPAVSSPVFDGGDLYISTLTGKVYCIDILKRVTKWHSMMGPLVSTPLLTDSLLIGATFNGWIEKNNSSNRIFSMSRDNGHIIWDLDIAGDFFSSPCLMNKQVIIGSLNKKIYCLDITGDILWTFETNGEIWSSPSHDGEFIYIGSDDGHLYSLNFDGSLRWKTRLNGKIRSSSPCLSEFDHLLFCGTYEGGMYCLDSVTGSVKWSKQIAKPVLSSPSLIEGNVFFATSNNAVYCLGSRTGTMVWEFEVGDRVWSSPCAVQNDTVLFFGCLDSHAYGLNIQVGKPEWIFPTMGMIDSSPCLGNGLLFICSRDGLLYVFGPTTVPNYMG